MLPLAVEIDDLGLGFITLSVDFVLGLYEDVVDIVVHPRFEVRVVL